MKKHLTSLLALAALTTTGATAQELMGARVSQTKPAIRNAPSKKAAAHESGAQKNGTILHGVNGFGEVVAYIADDAVRIQYPVAGLNILCKKPTYEVIWFNPPAKSIMRESLAHFRARSDMPPKERDARTMRQHEVTFSGIPANRVSVEDNAQNDFILPTMGAPRRAKMTATNFYFVKDIETDPTLQMFLNTCSGFPKFGGVPIGRTHNYADSTTSTDFKYNRREKGKLPSGIFDVPVGYKTVYSQPDVARGPGYQKQFDDLARGMGLGEKLGK